MPFCPIFPRYFARPEWASLSFAFLLNLPPLWRTARPRSGRSVRGPVIICLLFHLPTFIARGPSGTASHGLSAQLSPVMARVPSRPAYCLPLCSICPRFGARLERACLSMPCCSLKSAARAGQLIICAVRAGQFVICPYACFAALPHLSEKHSMGGGGGGGTPYYSMKGCSFSRTKGNGYGGLLLALHKSTPAKCACVANILNASVNGV